MHGMDSLQEGYIISYFRDNCLEWDSNLGLQQPLYLNLSDDLNHSATMAGLFVHLFFQCAVHCVQANKIFMNSRVYAAISFKPCIKCWRGKPNSFLIQFVEQPFIHPSRPLFFPNSVSYLMCCIFLPAFGWLYTWKLFEKPFLP